MSEGNIIPGPWAPVHGQAAVTTSGEPCEVLGCRAGLVLIQYQNGVRRWLSADLVLMGDEERFRNALSIMHGSYDLPSDTEQKA